MKSEVRSPRVLYDTNILVSYLMTDSDVSTIARVVHLAIDRRVTMLIPSQLLAELVRVTRSKVFVRERVSESDIDSFINILGRIGERIEQTEPVINTGLRDKDDDYLISAAIAGTAEFLVTGDKDLLAIRDIVKNFLILTPAEFLAVFEARRG